MRKQVRKQHNWPKIIPLAAGTAGIPLVSNCIVYGLNNYTGIVPCILTSYSILHVDPGLKTVLIKVTQTLFTTQANGFQDF